MIEYRLNSVKFDSAKEKFTFDVNLDPFWSRSFSHDDTLTVQYAKKSDASDASDDRITDGVIVASGSDEVVLKKEDIYVSSNSLLPGFGGQDVIDMMNKTSKEPDRIDSVSNINLGLLMLLCAAARTAKFKDEFGSKYISIGLSRSSREGEILKESLDEFMISIISVNASDGRLSGPGASFDVNKIEGDCVTSLALGCASFLMNPPRAT